MLKHALPLALLPLLMATAHANNCDAIKADIDARVRAGGLSNHSLSVVDKSAPAAGRVVGSCDQGSKKILMTQPALPGQPARPAQAASGPVAAVPVAGTRRDNRRSSATDDILTECKDGSIITGPDCSKARGGSPAPQPGSKLP